eukprot:gene6116-5969_t
MSSSVRTHRDDWGVHGGLVAKKRDYHVRDPASTGSAPAVCATRDLVVAAGLARALSTGAGHDGRLPTA